MELVEDGFMGKAIPSHRLLNMPAQRQCVQARPRADGFLKEGGHNNGSKSVLLHVHSRTRLKKRKLVIWTDERSTKGVKLLHCLLFAFVILEYLFIEGLSDE